MGMYIGSTPVSGVRFGTNVVQSVYYGNQLVFADLTTFFANGETGDYWRLKDLTTLFQDSAGSTPVTTTSDPIGRVVGKVNGNALTQGTGANKPIITIGAQNYATFDGNNDSLKGTFTLNQPATLVMGFNVPTYTNSRFILDGGNTNQGSLSTQTASPNTRLYAGLGGGVVYSGIYGSPHVITFILNGGSSKIATNNNSYTTGNPGTVNPGGLTIGAAGNQSLFGNVQWYGGLYIGRVLTDMEIALARAVVAADCGITI